MIHLSNTSSSCNCLTAFHTPRNRWLRGLLVTTNRISPSDFPICSQLSHTVIYRLLLTFIAQEKVWKSHINRQHLHKTVNRFQGQLDPNTLLSPPAQDAGASSCSQPQPQTPQLTTKWVKTRLQVGQSFPISYLI